MKVTVVYARPGVQLVLEADVEQGATVADAIAASGLLVREPQLGRLALSVGVWNRAATLDARLAPGDRVEVYRPLAMDPKEARRLRADVRRRRGADPRG